MLAFLIRRLVQAVPVLIGVCLLTFLIIRIAPGDPVRLMLGPLASPDAIAFWREFYRLDDPLWAQFVSFLGRLVTLDFGQSISLRAPVGELIGARIGVSLTLIAMAVTLALLIAVPLAVLSAARRGQTADVIVKLGLMVTFAMPAFWLGLVLVQVFVLRLGWFPASGLREGVPGLLHSLFLPALTVALYLAPVLVRTLREQLIETMRADHVEAARARGLAPGRIMRRYVLRNSLISTVMVLGVSLGYLIGGTLVVENVFALPGLGRLIVGGVGARDFPLIEATVLLVGFSVVTASILADLATAALDPRVRT
jgi:peptide/nickel transport system permease protein